MLRDHVRSGNGNAEPLAVELMLEKGGPVAC